MTTFDKIRQWADDRGLIENSTPKAQMTKLWEEYDELQAAIRAMDIEEIKDAIGDCMVVLTIIEAQMDTSAINVHPDQREYWLLEDFVTRLSGLLISGAAVDPSFAMMDVARGLVATANLFGLPIEDCIDHAYDQIKDRNGHMNEAGVFVKEEA